jgi:hypothetical protein
MEFDGQSCVDCGNDPRLDIIDPLTISIWIRPGMDGNMETAPLSKADATAGWSWQLRYQVCCSETIHRTEYFYFQLRKVATWMPQRKLWQQGL